MYHLRGTFLTSCMHINSQYSPLSILYNNIFKPISSQCGEHKGIMQMGISYYLVLILLGIIVAGNAQPLVPAIITFGDSSVDVGNNDYIHTIFKADFPPYGRDFKNHVATGRFCNGKLATDITGWQIDNIFPLLF